MYMVPNCTCTCTIVHEVVEWGTTFIRDYRKGLEMGSYITDNPPSISNTYVCLDMVLKWWVP